MTELLDSIGSFQLIVDLGLLLIVGLLIVLLRKGPAGIEASRIYAETEEFVAASEEMVEQFKLILAEKRNLINNLERKLNDRTMELTRLLDETDKRIEELKKAPQPTPPPINESRPFTKPKNQTHQLPLTENERSVLDLYRKGLPAARIATELRLPKGEVELILGLHKQS